MRAVETVVWDVVGVVLAGTFNHEIVEWLAPREPLTELKRESAVF